MSRATAFAASPSSPGSSSRASQESGHSYAAILGVAALVLALFFALCRALMYLVYMATDSTILTYIFVDIGS